MLKQIAFTTMAILLNSHVSIYAQPHHDNIWIFSDLNGASVANFSTGAVTIDSIDTDLMMAGASASICDANGDLAFYTNGCRIYNWQHRLMDNGEGLNPGDIYDVYCDLNDPFPRGYPVSPQSATIVPWPGHEDKYILLHISIEINTDTLIPFYAVPTKIYSTTVDMSANNGEGVVLDKNTIVDTSLIESKMLLNRHANGKDWWLVNPLLSSNNFNVFLVDSSGVNFSHQQSIGVVDSFINVSADQLVFTPMGDQLLRFSVQEGLRLFDFDRFTGELSNYRLISFPQGSIDLLRFSGVAVSPSGQFAYVSNQFEIYQYDLWADDIAASQLLIAELIDDGEMILRPTVELMQLGPDCKIYAYMVNGNRHHIIHSPDERGAACGWEQGGMLLGHYVFRDQPTFPNFRLGPVGNEGSPCAEPIVSTTAAPENRIAASIFPNPAEREVAFSVAKGSVSRVSLFDVLGQVVVERKVNLPAGAVGRLPLRNVAAGTYLLRLELDDGRMVVRKLIVRQP